MVIKLVNQTAKKNFQIPQLKTESQANSIDGVKVPKTKVEP
jgi:hypothetical protein